MTKNVWSYGMVDMKYNNIIEGIFLNRVNRFLAHCLVEGEKAAVHVPNTSRLTELCIEGAPVILQKALNPNRKTQFTLIHIQKNGVWINIDSHSPNQIVFEAIEKNPRIIQLSSNPDLLKREVAYGKSRFDLYYESGEDKGFIEVKGVTLEKGGTAMFPGAPTKRGVKHIYELIRASHEGYTCGLFFCIQIPYATYFRPHRELDPEFSAAYDLLKKNKINIYSYRCQVRPEEVLLDKKISHE